MVTFRKTQFDVIEFSPGEDFHKGVSRVKLGRGTGKILQVKPQ